MECQHEPHPEPAEALLRVAADIGGTFTDVAVEDGTARYTAKVLTTPQRT